MKPKTKTKTPEAVFTCPECGREFGRAASLGAHRSRAHGIRSLRASPAAATNLNASLETNPLSDRLLGLVFGDRIPPRADVVDAARAWLDQADTLAKMR